MPNRKAVKTWIVVADGARARIFEQAAWRRPLELVEERNDDLARQKTSETVSDGAGRSFDSGGKGRHAMAAPTDPQRHEKAKFAAELAGVINAAAQAGRYDRLVLIAPARTLGDLRGGLDKAAANKVGEELAKDLTTIAAHDLPHHLGDILEVGPEAQ